MQRAGIVSGNDGERFLYRFQPVVSRVQSVKGVRCCYSSPLAYERDLNESLAAGSPVRSILVRF